MNTMDNLFAVKVLSHEETRTLFDKHSTSKLSLLCDDILFQISDNIYLGWDNFAANEELALCDLSTNQRVSFAPFEAGAIMAQLMTAERWLHEFTENGNSVANVGNCDINEMFQGLGTEVAIDLENGIVTLSHTDIDGETLAYIVIDSHLFQSLAYALLACTRHISKAMEITE